jgi:hypothetical protein
MAWEQLFSIVQWLLPSGVATTVFAWYANRTNRHIQEIKDSHDTYKMMYEDVKKTLIDEINEKKLLRRSIGRLEKAIGGIQKCSHADDCPVDRELRKLEADKDDSGNPDVGQHSNQRED